MKTLEQKTAQLKRQIKNAFVWVNFIAVEGNITYMSGHDAQGREQIISSEGIWFEGITYKAGRFYFGANNVFKKEASVNLQNVKAIDNSDFSKPTPSSNVSKFAEEFEFTFSE